MSRVEPVDPRVRLAISQWPPDAPRAAVSSFCLEHGISQKTFTPADELGRVEPVDGLGEGVVVRVADGSGARFRAELDDPVGVHDGATRDSIGIGRSRVGTYLHCFQRRLLPNVVGRSGAKQTVRSLRS